jgi:hypothetical protein
VEGGFDPGELLQAPGEEDELVRPLEIWEVFPGPLGAILEGPAQRSVPSGGKTGEGTALLEVQQVEPEGSLGNVALALVEVNPFDELLLRQPGNECDRDLHDSSSTIPLHFCKVRKLAGPSSARILPRVFRDSGNAQKRPWEARGGAAWRR